MNVIEYLGYKNHVRTAWWMQMAGCGLLLLVYFNEAVRERFFWPSHVGFLVFAVLVPFLIYRKIRCPQCGHQLVRVFSLGGKGKNHPFSSGRCPKCGFAPYLRANRNVDGSVKPTPA